MLWTGLAPIQRGKQAARWDSWRQSGISHCSCCQHRGSEAFRSGRDFSARVELSAHVLGKRGGGFSRKILGGRILPLAANVYREAVAGPRRGPLL